MITWAGEGWAQSFAPPVSRGYGSPAASAATDAQITYTPLRRPGSVPAPAPAPTPAQPPVPYAPPVPAVPPPVYVPPPAPVYAPAPAPVYSPDYTPAPGYTPSPGYAPTPVYAPFAPPAVSVPTPSLAREPAGTVAAAKLPAHKAGRRVWGLGLDAGMPDGLNLALTLVPVDWLRLQAALGTNTAGLAYRGGLSFVPVGWGPSFTAEVGHCNLAGTNSLLRTFFSVPSWVSPYVQELGYTYFNAHLGFDYTIGRLTLFVHGGYSFLVASVRAPNAVVVDKNTNTTVTIAQDGKIYVSTLSAKLGLIFMFGGS